MAIDDILARISSDTGQEVDFLKRDAEKEIKVIMAEGEEEADSLRKGILKDALGQVEAERARRLSMERVEGRQAVLREKRRSLREVFEESWGRLQKTQDDEHYCEIFRHLLLRTADSSDGEVFIRKLDRERITGDFLEEVNRTFSASGRKTRVKMAGEFAQFTEGGFILKEGRKQTDCTFDSLFKMLREEIEPQAAKMLFDKQRLNVLHLAL